MRKFLFVVACLTQADLDLAVKKGACDAMCKNAGYSVGFYRQDQCGCLDFFSYREFTEKKIKLPTRLTVPTSSD